MKYLSVITVLWFSFGAAATAGEPGYSCKITRYGFEGQRSEEITFQKVYQFEGTQKHQSVMLKSENANRSLTVTEYQGKPRKAYSVEAMSCDGLMNCKAQRTVFANSKAEKKKVKLNLGNRKVVAFAGRRPMVEYSVVRNGGFKFSTIEIMTETHQGLDVECVPR